MIQNEITNNMPFRHRKYNRTHQAYTEIGSGSAKAAPPPYLGMWGLWFVWFLILFVIIYECQFIRDVMFDLDLVCVRHYIFKLYFHLCLVFCKMIK